MEELIAYYPWLSLGDETAATSNPPAAENAARAFGRLPEGAPRMMGDYRPRERVIRLRERRNSRRESGYSLHVHLHAA
jgi:hypothetical protein